MDAKSKLPAHHIQWYETLIEAAKNNDLALMLCADAVTGEYRSVLALANRHEDGSIDFIPVGHLCPTENPFEAYQPPETEPRRTH